MTLLDVPSRSIVVVRHGETDWNAARLIQGRTEIALNDIGRAQAQETAEALAAFGAWPGVISSPLGRAAETAGIIATHLGLATPTVDSEILERNFGPAEGQSIPLVEEKWPGLNIPGAETIDELAARGARAFARLIDERPGSIVVAHGALIRVSLSKMIGTEMPRVVNGEAWLLRAIDHAGEGSASTSPGFRAERLGAPVVAAPK